MIILIMLLKERLKGFLMILKVKRIIFLSLPYFGLLSEDFKKRLTNLVQPIFAKVKAIL
jgi:hypothetical protein